MVVRLGPVVRPATVADPVVFRVADAASSPASSMTSAAVVPASSTTSAVAALASTTASAARPEKRCPALATFSPVIPACRLAAASARLGRLLRLVDTGERLPDLRLLAQLAQGLLTAAGELRVRALDLRPVGLQGAPELVAGEAGTQALDLGGQFGDAVLHGLAAGRGGGERVGERLGDGSHGGVACAERREQRCRAVFGGSPVRRVRGGGRVAGFGCGEGHVDHSGSSAPVFFPPEGPVDVEQHLLLPLGEVRVGEDGVRDGARRAARSRIPART